MGCKDTQACENQKSQNFEKATRSALRNSSKNSQCRPKSQKSKRFYNDLINFFLGHHNNEFEKENF